MTRAYIGLGGNIGDPVASIRKSFDLLKNVDGVSSAKLSPLYKTAPVGYIDQDWFYNAVVELDVDFGCRTMLKHCLGIEQELKRVREIRWGPRIIDLDVLIFGDEEICEDSLVIPHPRAHERAFVLRPLVDLNSNLVLAGKPISVWLERVRDQELEEVVF